MTNTDSPNIDLYQVSYYSDCENTESEILLRKEDDCFFAMEICDRKPFKHHPKRKYIKPLKKPTSQYKYIKDIYDDFDTPPDCCVIQNFPQ